MMLWDHGHPYNIIQSTPVERECVIEDTLKLAAVSLKDFLSSTIIQYSNAIHLHLHVAVFFLQTQLVASVQEDLQENKSSSISHPPHLTHSPSLPLFSDSTSLQSLLSCATSTTHSLYKKINYTPTYPHPHTCTHTLHLYHHTISTDSTQLQDSFQGIFIR